MNKHTPTHYEVSEYDGTQYFRIVEVGSVRQVVALSYRRDVAEEIVRNHNSHEELLATAKKFHEWLEDVIGLKLDHKIGENVEGCIGCSAIAKGEAKL